MPRLCEAGRTKEQQAPKEKPLAMTTNLLAHLFCKACSSAEGQVSEREKGQLGISFGEEGGGQ